MAPIYTNIEIFENLLNDLVSPIENIDFSKLITIDATGFILGGALALKLKKGLILARKEGKIPLDDNRIIKRHFTDYSGNEKILEIDKTLIEKNEKYVIIDDWVETGSQVKATISMIEELGGIIVGILSIGSDKNENTQILFEKYNLHSIGINV